MATERELAVSTIIGGVHYEAGSSVPADIAELVTNPAVWGGTQADDEPEGYEALKVKDLQAEIDARNKGRDEAGQITPASAKKADLIAALEADDAAQSSD